MIIVVGWPRTGTSMIMNVLQAGNYPVLVDNLISESANPNGFFEYQRAKSMPEVVVSENLNEIIALKLFYRQLNRILEANILPEKIISTERSIDEMLDSWAVAFPNALINKEDLMRIKEETLTLVYGLNIPILKVNFHALIDDTETQVDRIIDFIGEDLDREAMISVPDNRYRHFGGSHGTSAG